MICHAWLLLSNWTNWVNLTQTGWIKGNLQSSFPLIQPFVVKLTQLAQFDKTSDACQCMKLVNVWGTACTESSAAYLAEHHTYILRAWVPTLPMFYSLVTFLANLTNLTNLLSHNYRRTQLSVMSWRMDAVVPVLRGLVPGMLDERKFPLPPT